MTARQLFERASDQSVTGAEWRKAVADLQASVRAEFVCCNGEVWGFEFDGGTTFYKLRVADLDAELSDEEYGRLWAAENGVRVENDIGGEYITGLDEALGSFTKCVHESKPKAYAEIGRSVRAFHAAVPKLGEKKATGG